VLDPLEEALANEFTRRASEQRGQPIELQDVRRRARHILLLWHLIFVLTLVGAVAMTAWLS
jgi:predicted nucleic acid-binding Zn ribbon protein